MDMQRKGITSGVPPSGVGGPGCFPLLIVRNGLGLDRHQTTIDPIDPIDPIEKTRQIEWLVRIAQKHWKNTQKPPQKTLVTKAIP